jgi:hypothetical protein
MLLSVGIVLTSSKHVRDDVSTNIKADSAAIVRVDEEIAGEDGELGGEEAKLDVSASKRSLLEESADLQSAVKGQGSTPDLTEEQLPLCGVGTGYRRQYRSETDSRLRKPKVKLGPSFADDTSKYVPCEEIIAPESECGKYVGLGTQTFTNNTKRGFSDFWRVSVLKVEQPYICRGRYVGGGDFQPCTASTRCDDGVKYRPFRADDGRRLLKTGDIVSSNKFHLADGESPFYPSL